MMNRPPICLLYASHDGHTRKIATVLAGHLVAAGRYVELYDLGHAPPKPEDLNEADTLVLMAPIRYGYPLPTVDQFIQDHRPLLQTKHLALALINLTARKPNKNTAATNPYFRKWLKRSGLSPDQAAVFAGMLDYARYNWWERGMIRLIMKITGGPTDLSTRQEFTNWADVESFARELASLAETKTEAA